MTELHFYDTMTRQKRVLDPVTPGRVGVYVCGPTVYDRAHLGNARSAVAFDVLHRVLRDHFGAANVTFVRNLTDIDDKINARAAETGRPIADITEETVAWYHADMAALGVLSPTEEPRATGYIPEMIAMIEELVAAGHAYEAAGHVLFEVKSFPDYGALSGRSLEDMIAGARVEVAPFKRDPMDFVLWKPSDAATPGWDSPWGRGRPGWHIECSAMARALLGQRFDIHGGGLDLQFPHHENEIAQSRACCGPGSFANLWLHNEMLQVEGRKMSKSLGNFFTVRALLDAGTPGEVIRFVFLMTHYAKPMDWTEEKARTAETTLRNWHALTEGVDPGMPAPSVRAALADDLNTPLALAQLHALAQAGDGPGLLASARLLGLLAFGAEAWTSIDAETEALIEALIADRAAARDAKQYALADRIRDAFADAGVEVMDGAAETRWTLKPGFDIAKLDGLR